MSSPAMIYDIWPNSMASTWFRSILTGAIETIFVSPAVQQFGKFDGKASTLRCNAAPLPDNQDLVNLAVILALRTRAWVEVVPSGSIPGGGVIAAVLRCPFIHAAHVNGRA